MPRESAIRSEPGPDGSFRGRVDGSLGSDDRRPRSVPGVPPADRRRVRPERRAAGLRREELSLAWDEGVLAVAAEHDDESRGRRRSYHRRFRFPKSVDDEGIDATYTNGVLEVRLPIERGVTLPGREIEIGP